MAATKIAPLTLPAEELQEFARQNGLSDLVGEKPQAPPGKAISIGILSYDGKIMCRTMMCIIGAATQCAQRAWGLNVILRESDSMVARGRSFIASQFLQNPGAAHCTDLVFIDGDLTWDGDEFVRLCSHNVDVVGGCYPYKDESGDFPLRWPPDGLFEENGLWRVHAVTPGFLKVSRRALQKIANEMPWLEFKDRGNQEGQRSWMFFDNTHRPSGIYDEGYIFCEHWRTCGGVVYMDPDLRFKHIGLKAYSHGTIREWLDKKSEKFSQLESEYPGIPPLVLMNKVMGQKIDLDKLKAEAEANKAISPEKAQDILDAATIKTDEAKCLAGAMKDGLVRQDHALANASGAAA